MNRSVIGIIIFCVFLGSHAAGNNTSFSDSISILGATCILSVPIDSNSLFSSFEHPCSNYFFFKLGNRSTSCMRNSNLFIQFSSTVKCTLFLRQVQFWDLPKHPSDTLPISCDSLIYWISGNSPFLYNSFPVASVNDSIIWRYTCPDG